MAEKQKNEWDEREIGALWTKDDRFFGNINGEKVVIFKNKFKEGVENRPDYRVYKEKALESKGAKKPKDDDDLPL